MFAGTICYATTPEGIERGIQHVDDELRPALASIDGYVGLSMLIDHPTGRCITAIAWRSAQAMRESEPQVAPLRQRYLQACAAEDPSTNDWEVALMHRAHTLGAGAHARVTWFQGDIYAIEDSIDAFRAEVRNLEGVGGFASASLLIDRDGGYAASTMVYDSTAALTKSRAPASEIHTRVSEETRAQVTEVTEFEVAVAQLRVPELV